MSLEKWQRQCVECGRVFDMTEPDEAGEYLYGHDCEGEIDAIVRHAEAQLEAGQENR